MSRATDRALLLRDRNVRLSRMLEQLTAQLGRSPTIAELAKAAGVEDEEVLEAFNLGSADMSDSLSSGRGDRQGDIEFDLLDAIGHEEREHGCPGDRALLGRGSGRLDERERKILRLRFFERETLWEIAQRVGGTQMHVSRLIQNSLAKIRDAETAYSDA